MVEYLASMATDPPRLKIGIVTPVLTLLPRAHAKWEATATINDVRIIAEAADALGVHHLTCSEHVAIPSEVARTRGSRYWDPLATFGYLAAHTHTIKFATHVLVLGYHHPLEIAKSYGTLDQIADGRVVLGVGVGSLREEFELLSASFDDRGSRGDDALRALRSAFGRSAPTYDGTHYAFRDFIVDPCGTQTNVPIWVGGRSSRSLRRAVELADGWVPFGLSIAEITTMIGAAQQTAAWHERHTPVEIWLQPETPLDPLGDPEATRSEVAAMRAGGATGVNARLRHTSRDHYIEQVQALLTIVSATRE